MSKTFKQVNIHKAAEPDGLPGCVLKACVDQLVSVFTDIFNISLTESVILTCFKQTTIVPVLNEAKVTCLNDYHPVALMSVTMKCFERLVMPETLDPLQFAYCPNKSTDDGISNALHTAPPGQKEHIMMAPENKADILHVPKQYYFYFFHVVL